MPSRSGPEAASGFSGVRRDCACTEMALRRWGATPAGGRDASHPRSWHRWTFVVVCGGPCKTPPWKILGRSGDFPVWAAQVGRGPRPASHAFPTERQAKRLASISESSCSLVRWTGGVARPPERLGWFWGGKTRCHHRLRQRFAPLVYRSVTVLRDRIGVSPTTQGTRPVRRWARPFQSDG